MEELKMETENKNQLYSNEILDAYVMLIREKYPDIDIEDLMAEAGIGNYGKTGHDAVTLCQAQLNRFHERLCMLTDNMNIPRQAGRYAVTPQCLGMIPSRLLPLPGFGGPVA